MGDRLFHYAGPRFSVLPHGETPYSPEYFEPQLSLESAVFFDLRMRNGIKPYRLTDCSTPEKEEIRRFFYQHRDSFLMAFRDGILAASILWVGNYIQSLAVDPRFQGQGYGRRLTGLAVNRIYEAGYDQVVLKVMEGNDGALGFYRKLGFVEGEPPRRPSA